MPTSGSQVSRTGKGSLTKIIQTLCRFSRVKKYITRQKSVAQPGEHVEDCPGECQNGDCDPYVPILVRQATLVQHGVTHRHVTQGGYCLSQGVTWHKALLPQAHTQAPLYCLERSFVVQGRYGPRGYIHGVMKNKGCKVSSNQDI